MNVFLFWVINVFFQLISLLAVVAILQEAKKHVIDKYPFCGKEENISLATL
jgi:hypothetical protein